MGFTVQKCKQQNEPLSCVHIRVPRPQLAVGKGLLPLCTVQLLNQGCCNVKFGILKQIQILPC